MAGALLVGTEDAWDSFGRSTMPEIIQPAIWLYVRFTLSFRDVEDLLAERGIFVSYETVRRWVNHFGPKIAGNGSHADEKDEPVEKELAQVPAELRLAAQNALAAVQICGDSRF
jgi:hypothetical protein